MEWHLPIIAQDVKCRCRFGEGECECEGEGEGEGAEEFSVQACALSLVCV